MKYKFNHYSNKKSDLDKFFDEYEKYPPYHYNLQHNNIYYLIENYCSDVYCRDIYQIVVKLHSAKPIKKYIELSNKNESNKIFHDKFPQIEYYKNKLNVLFVDYIRVEILKFGNLYNCEYVGCVYDVDYKTYLNKKSCNIINNNFKKMLKCKIVEELDSGYCIYRCEKNERYGVIDGDMNVFFEPTYSRDNLEMLKKDFKHQYCLESNMKKIYE